MDNQERKALMTRQFRELYGAEPELWGRAPGRVDLMGSHTDYNLGYVMTMTIDRDTWIAARPRPDRQVALASLNTWPTCAGAGGGRTTSSASPGPARRPATPSRDSTPWCTARCPSAAA
jgi:hypothetical protein